MSSMKEQDWLNQQIAAANLKFRGEGPRVTVDMSDEALDAKRQNLNLKMRPTVAPLKQGPAYFYSPPKRVRITWKPKVGEQVDFSGDDGKTWSRVFITDIQDDEDYYVREDEQTYLDGIYSLKDFAPLGTRTGMQKDVYHQDDWSSLKKE